MLETLAISIAAPPPAARELSEPRTSAAFPLSASRGPANWAARILCLLLVGSAAQSARGTQRYVDISSVTPKSPYTSWATAATNIQDAVNTAGTGDVVTVNDGVYQFGATSFNGQSNRVVISKPLIVQSVNGPGSTTIQGYQVPGSSSGAAAVRCAYLTSGAVLSGFTLANGQNSSGGGVWCQATSALVTNCVFTGDSASNFGGGAYGGTLLNCSLTGNSSANGGGAAYANLTNCDLAGNSASARGGGAYYCNLTNSTFENNSATDGGGAAFGTSGGCAFTGNNASGNGGGSIYATIIDCTLAGNQANLSGGGAYQAMAIHCAFNGNSAVQYFGGGIAYGSATRCTLNNNSAEDGAGAAACSIDDSLISYNTASSLGGGTYNCTVVNCTVVYNTATSGGGTFSCTLRNSIIYYNTAPNGNCANIINISYSCTTPYYGIWPGNIASDPQLDANFRLQTGSPCIDAGQNSYAVSATDLDGNPRLAHGTVDLGAYELPSVAAQLFHAWLAQYGLPSDGSADYLDSDGDGMNNWQEYLAGTDPTDPASVLEMISGPSASSQDITWMSVPTRTYSLLRSTNLSPATFSVLQSNLPGQSGTTAFTDSDMTGSQQFYYRVLVDGGLPPQ